MTIERTVWTHPLSRLTEEEAKLVKATFAARAQKFNEAMVQLSIHTPTELALVTCSILEQMCKDILRSYMINLSHQEERKLFEYPGPLNSFSSRILLIYSFGLIPKEIKDELEAVGTIRNKFAHNFDISSFEDTRIGDVHWIKLKTLTRQLLVETLKEIVPGHEQTEADIPRISGKEVGAVLEDSQGNIGLWIDVYLEDVGVPKSKFINSVKSMFMILGTLALSRYFSTPHN